MAASALSALWFHDEAAAYAKLESILWPNGPHCPRCGGFDRITKVDSLPRNRKLTSRKPAPPIAKLPQERWILSLCIFESPQTRLEYAPRVLEIKPHPGFRCKWHAG